MYTKCIVSGVVVHSVSGFPAIGERVYLRQVIDGGAIAYTVQDLHGGLWLAEWSYIDGRWTVKVSENYPVLIIE